MRNNRRLRGGALYRTRRGQEVAKKELEKNLKKKGPRFGPNLCWSFTDADQTFMAKMRTFLTSKEIKIFMEEKFKRLQKKKVCK